MTRITHEAIALRKTIEAIFENGVFRPLQPVAIPERQRVRIALDDAALQPKIEPLPIAELPLDDLMDENEIPSLPIPEVGRITVRVVYAGSLPLSPYPEN